MCWMAGCGAQEASQEAITVTVTISSAGQLVAAQTPVTVTDMDADGALTISDALIAAHDALYEGGAEAGYAAQAGDYGLSLTKLWGVENGGSYGYGVNNITAWNLKDPVADGDYVYAFSYADLTGWSDCYSYFDTPAATAEAGEVTLTLFYIGYDADFNPVELPVAGAAVVINGEASQYVTDEDGRATVRFDGAGTYVVSALSDTLTLVPPVCTVTVE